MKERGGFGKELGESNGTGRVHIGGGEEKAFEGRVDGESGTKRLYLGNVSSCLHSDVKETRTPSSPGPQQGFLFRSNVSKQALYF